MAFESQLPAPSVEWDLDFTFPQPPRTVVATNDVGGEDMFAARGWAQNGSAAWQLFRGSAGGAGAECKYYPVAGRMAARHKIAGVPHAMFWQMLWMSMAWEGGAANVNAGATWPPMVGSVYVFDYFRVVRTAAAQATDGVFFVATDGTSGYTVADEPTGGTPRSCFGIVGTGGGNTAFRSWAAGGALLADVDLTAAIGLASAWHSVRLIITAANAIRNADLTVMVGANVLHQDTFGSGTLQLPSAALPNGWGWALHHTLRTVGPEIGFQFRHRHGRFLPDGTALQAQ